MLPDQQALTAEFKPELLSGVQVVKGKAIAWPTMRRAG